jgi:hypothetical protein
MSCAAPPPYAPAEEASPPVSAAAAASGANLSSQRRIELSPLRPARISPAAQILKQSPSKDKTRFQQRRLILRAGVGRSSLVARLSSPPIRELKRDVFSSKMGFEPFLMTLVRLKGEACGTTLP